MSEGPSGQATEDVPSEGLQENGEPTMINVRSEGLKVDLVLLKNRVSGLTIDYQGISENKELHKWLRIIDGMLSGSAPSPEGSIPQILGEAAKFPASQPQRLERSEDGPQENGEPTMINVRSEGLKVDLVLLKNRVSGLTIDYQGISEGDELQKWIRIIEGIISEPATSPESSIPQILGRAARPSFSQPDLPKEEQVESPDETGEQTDSQKEEQTDSQKEEQTDSQKEEQTDSQKEHMDPQKEEQTDSQKEEQTDSQKENGYRKVVLRAADVSLNTLGRDGKQAILSLLENRYGFREDDIPDYPRSFVELLHELLGASAQNLEREIMNNIRKVCPAPGENLEAVVESLKENYQTAAQVEADAQEPMSAATDASMAEFRYNATISRRRH
ncbi:MAG: hypothetical protein ABSB56_08930 [Nitrososphaerales archaeon]